MSGHKTENILPTPSVLGVAHQVAVDLPGSVPVDILLSKAKEALRLSVLRRIPPGHHFEMAARADRFLIGFCEQAFPYVTKAQMSANKQAQTMDRTIPEEANR